VLEVEVEVEVEGDVVVEIGVLDVLKLLVEGVEAVVEVLTPPTVSDEDEVV
jgi:hypothetical protein